MSLIQLRSWAGGHQKAHPILFYFLKKEKNDPILFLV
jgi:hypothetical protein